MRIRIVQSPPIQSIDGIQLDCFAVGSEYEVGHTLAELFLAEGWAEPLPFDAPQSAGHFGDRDPWMTRVVDPAHPRNLTRETYAPYLDPPVKAADFPPRRRRG